MLARKKTLEFMYSNCLILQRRNSETQRDTVTVSGHIADSEADSPFCPTLCLPSCTAIPLAPHLLRPVAETLPSLTQNRGCRPEPVRAAATGGRRDGVYESGACREGRR